MKIFLAYLLAAAIMLYTGRAIQADYQEHAAAFATASGRAVAGLGR